MRRALVLAWLTACSFEHGRVPGAGGDALLDPDAQMKEWSSRRKLSIDNPRGALDQFAVMVALDATRVSYDKTNAGGADLRFTDLAGTMLAHEIEHWDASGRSIVWVGIPTLAAGATEIWMYYGNPAATDAQRAADVWDDHYVGVWHLADARDSTTTNTSTSVGTTPAVGQIGPAVQVGTAAAAQYVDTGANEQLATWTIEVWMRPAGASALVTSSGPLSRGYNYQIQWNCGDLAYCRSVNFVAQSGTAIAPYGNAQAMQWSRVAATFDGSTLQAYLNQTPATPVAATGPPATEIGTTKLGARVDLSGFYAGAIDEARISRIARSADYIVAHYLSTTDMLVTYGAEE